MSKKKLINVKPCNSNPYSSTLRDKLYYAFVSKPNDQIGRVQCHPFVCCRDFLNDILRKHHFKSTNILNYGGYTYGASNSIDIDKVRLLLASGPTTKDIKQNLFSAKAAINVYENIAGWKPSTITTVNCGDLQNVWLITGPKQWLRYSNLLSMYTLILRLGFNHGPIPHESVEELTSFWKHLCKTDTTSTNSDITYLAESYNKFPVIMKHYSDIFTEDIPIAFRDPSIYSSSDFHSRGGIYEMCCFTTNLGKLDTKFKEACAKEGI